MTRARAGSILVRYEAALWSVLGAMAYLARENADLVYPDILWLFAVLLGVSLVSAWAVRRRPDRDLPHAAFTVLSFCVIAAIQSRSGGARSNLWVLYLLPLFSSALLLGGRELALLAAGATLCDAMLYAGPGAEWGASVAFELTVKTGVFWAAAGSVWYLAEAERRALARVDGQRAELERLAAGLKRAEGVQGRESALTALGLASAAAAHDMSTPLMVIRGYSRVRLEQKDLDPELRKDLERIDRAAAFCQRLAADTLTRARSGEPASGRLSLVSALENALALSAEVLTRRGITVERDYADDDFGVRGDGPELERLFLNLIANAAKAMPGGGVLTLRLRIDAKGARPEVLASLEDTGPGIPPEVLPRLFGPFVTTRAGLGGTGLGLHLCRETARRCGGDITAANLDGGGARFLVRLPRSAPVETARA
jgi:two-component system C4-dicarboxylate transport sensor histidine kinase DctB